MKELEQIKSFIKEGVYDPGIFKAFFMAGGPGSGKSFVSSSAFAGSGLKFVNSDTIFERGLRKAGLSMSMPDQEEYFRNIIRAKAKMTTNTQLDTYVAGRLGLVIDATGRDYSVISRQFTLLNQLGYDCYMFFVNTSLDVALERNKTRSRSIPEYIVQKSWTGVQSNMGKFQRLFGLSNMVIIDNNRSEKELVTQTLNTANRMARSLMNKPVNNFTAKQWIKNELAAKKRK